MPNDESDAASRLWWALRRHWLLMVNMVVVFVAVAVLAAPQQASAPKYEAAALVAAADLEIRPEGLPRFSRAVFLAGTVADGTVAATGIDVDPDDLIPDVINLEPIEETVLLRVVGIHEDPAVAEQLADAAAGILTDQLNLLGPGVGDFVVLEPARADVDPIPTPGPLVPVVLAALAGLAFGLGLVGFVLALRRPALSTFEVGRLVAAPVLGTIVLPTGDRDPEPTDVPGLAAMLQQVFTAPNSVVVTVGLRGDHSAKHRVATLLTRGMARRGPVRFVDLDRQGFPLDALAPREAQHVDVAEVPPPAGGSDRPTVIDGPTTDGLDVPQFLPPDATVLLVVREGARARSVEAAGAQFLPGELTGVVFVPYRSRLGGLFRRQPTRPGPTDAGSDESSPTVA